ncbi:MAG: hypothetical protein ABW104_20875 [Candidatus Thiodiazotropha sp. 6PLUC2]
MTIFDENNHKSGLFRDTSFIGRLHEEGVVDTKEYFRLEEWLWESFEFHNSKMPKETVIRFGIMTSFVLKNIVHHQNKNDGYKIKNYTLDELHKLMDRMHQILEGLSDGKLPKREYLPNLPNA